MYARQGEVGIEKIGKLPEGLTVKDNVLARGEVTGHSHEVVGQAVVMTDSTTQYVQVNGTEAVLQHEEHKPVTLPKGTYRVRIQREYDILNDEVRQVRD